MELNEKDKELIAKIDERLKHYKLITDNEQPITEQKERWKITIEPFNYSPNDYRIVIACISGTVLSYNEANKIAEAIRETLKNI